MRHLSEGETMEVQGSGKKPYVLKNSGGVISCSCPAWRNQSLAIDVRTCKHIKANVSNGAPGVPVSTDGPPGGAFLSPDTEVGPKAPKNVPPCLLAHSWDGVEDVSGWLCSAKLDGVRAWWDGERFWSRLGNEYHAPQWFKDLMPKGVVLDGELFAGNGRFQETVSFVRKLNPVDKEWQELKFMVFDMPEEPGVYEQRMVVLAKLLRKEYMGYYVSDEVKNRHIDMLDYESVKENKSIKEWHLALAEKYGYEGIMLRKPGSLYEAGRSNTLLKVKSFIDCEVTVIGYQKGKGKHKGRVGSLDVRMDSGVEFNVGTGLSDEERENPPPVGSRVTVRYQELTKDGVPRFPSYLGIRDYE